MVDMETHIWLKLANENDEKGAKIILFCEQPMVLKKYEY